jgi:salicylate hydroxylase
VSIESSLIDSRALRSHRRVKLIADRTIGILLWIHSRGVEIAIVGAGLGGMSAAIALRRGGHRVIVFEQAPAVAEVGAGIQVAPNAARLLDRWGVMDKLAPRSVPAAYSNRRRWQDGRLLGRFELGELAVERYGSPYLCQHRADLHAALLDVATQVDGDGPPVGLQLGRAVVSVDPGQPGRPRLSFADGAAHETDGVIAADGIASRVRESLFGASASPLTGQVTQRMIIPLSSVDPIPELAALWASPDLNIWLGPNRHAVMHPVRGRAGVYLGVTTATESAEHAAELARTGHQQLLASLRDWDPCLRQMVAAADGVSSWPLYDRDVAVDWQAGRVCLLGDACHAMLPFQAQGAAQALEDAAVLGDELAGAEPDGVAAALSRFVQRRRPRAQKVLEASRANGDLFHFPDGPEQQARDAELAEGLGDFRAYLWLWAAEPDGRLRIPASGETTR